MDPITHTLFGATLAETGLRRATRLATPALLVGANLPDVDAVTSFIGRDLMYGFRRGWTHGVLAIAVLPWLLTGALVLYARLRPGGATGPPLRPWRLLGIAYLGVASHPLLDWINNYGVRLLMPLRDQWYYGDAIFIVDPWIWLMLGGAVVLARTGSRLSLAGFALLGILLSTLVLTTDRAPMPAKVLWAAWVVTIVAGRSIDAIRSRAQTAARWAVVALGVYISASLAGSAVARGQVRGWLQQRGVQVEAVVAGPIAANPFVRDVVAVLPDSYRFLRVAWLEQPMVTTGDPAIPINDGPLSRAALGAPEIAGYAHWLRLPAFEHEALPTGTRVWVRDVRYSRARASIGSAYVDFDHAGERVGASIGR